LRAHASAAICAAKGVPLREPLNPTEPALDHASTSPCGSVIVTIVLLNVACTCATPSGTLRRARRLRGAGAAPAAAPPGAAGACGADDARCCCPGLASLVSSAIWYYVRSGNPWRQTPGGDSKIANLTIELRCAAYQPLGGAAFLPATSLRGPLRVRAFVWVRWPRTGKPRRWRIPR